MALSRYTSPFKGVYQALTTSAAAGASTVMAGSSAGAAATTTASLTANGVMAAGIGSVGVYSASQMAAGTINDVSDSPGQEASNLWTEATSGIRRSLGVSGVGDFGGVSTPTMMIGEGNPDMRGYGAASVQGGFLAAGGVVGGLFGSSAGALGTMTPFNMGIQNGKPPVTNAGMNIGLPASRRASVMSGGAQLGSALGNRAARALQSRGAMRISGAFLGVAAGQALYESVIGTAADAVREAQQQVARPERGGPSIRRSSSAGSNVTSGRMGPQPNGRMALQLAKNGGKGPVMTG